MLPKKGSTKVISAASEKYYSKKLNSPIFLTFLPYKNRYGFLDMGP